MIISIDFDGTLQNSDKTPNLPLISRMVAEQRRGNIVILWTCREGKSLADAVQFLRQYGFAPNYINQNCPQAIRMMGHDSRKIYADVYIDDKNG